LGPVTKRGRTAFVRSFTGTTAADIDSESRAVQTRRGTDSRRAG